MIEHSYVIVKTRQHKRQGKRKKEIVIIYTFQVAGGHELGWGTGGGQRLYLTQYTQVE